MKKVQTILSIQNMSFGFPSEDIFDNVTFSIYEKDRVAIIGANGTGKTTLIKLILGKETPNKGNINLLRGITIGYLSQEVIQSEENTLYDEALLVFKDLIRIEKELQILEEKIAQNPNDQKLIDEYGKKQHYFQINNGYDYHYLIDMFLSKFGFKKEDYSRKINTFSGGEKTKMSFAKLLLSKPQLLILDEPTNHLDMLTKEELIDSLKEYEGSLVIVSHDRYFVDQVSNKLLYFTDHISFTYEGRYSSFKEEVLDEYEKEKSEKEVEVKETKDKYVPTHEVKRRPKLALNKIEEKMARIEKKLEDIHLSYEKEECYSSKSKMQELEQLEASLNKEYEELMEELSLYDQ